MTPGSGIEGSFECDLHVADNVDGRGENFRQGVAYDCGQLRAGGARTSHAGARDLCGRDAGSGAGLAHRLLQRLAGLHFSDANDVAGACGRGGEQVRIISHCAGGLRTAAVNAEIVGHGYF